MRGRRYSQSQLTSSVKTRWSAAEDSLSCARIVFSLSISLLQMRKERDNQRLTQTGTNP